MATAANPLFGVWECDDGGTYYINEYDGTVVWAGLQNSGFHAGIEFTNVFWGTFSPDRQSVIGEWVDVPRGQSEGSGILRFTLKPTPGGIPELWIDPTETTGGFGGKHWVKDDRLLQWDIVDIANSVYRADNMLGVNNPPCRDFTVMWGYTNALDALHVSHGGQIRLGLQGPEPLPPDPTYCSFVQSARHFWGNLPDWGDGDFTFNLLPDWNLTDPLGRFWTTGWVPDLISPGGGVPAMMRSQWIHDLFNGSPLVSSFIPNLDNGWQFFHCENMMYGRTNSDSDDECNAAPDVQLPGWNETSGNSILVNGRPIAGHVTPSDSGGGEHNFITFEIGPNGATVDLVIPQKVRVTGVVADDAGHPPGQPPEIHPVYQIDIITDDFMAAFPQTLSGAWHGSPDNGTYYIRQLGATVWWLGLSSDHGRTFANVFRGTLNNMTGVVEGEWIDIPMGLGWRGIQMVGGGVGGGTLQLRAVARQLNQGPPGHISHDLPGVVDHQNAHEIDKVSDPAVFGATSWLKLYDTPGQPAPDQGSISNSVGGGPNQLH